jgi:hypothetical protein
VLGEQISGHTLLGAAIAVGVTLIMLHPETAPSPRRNR